MTLAEFRQLTESMDEDTEILVSSSYDFDEGSQGMAVSDMEEIQLYHDTDGDRPVIVLLFNDEEKQ